VFTLLFFIVIFFFPAEPPRLFFPFCLSHILSSGIDWSSPNPFALMLFALPLLSINPKSPPHGTLAIFFCGSSRSQEHRLPLMIFRFFRFSVRPDFSSLPVVSPGQGCSLQFCVTTHTFHFYCRLLYFFFLPRFLFRIIGTTRDGHLLFPLRDRLAFGLMSTHSDLNGSSFPLLQSASSR